MKDARVRTRSDDPYINFSLEPTITFTPEDHSLDTLELRCYRHLGFVKLVSAHDFFKMPKMTVTSEFREFWRAHTRLLLAEVLKQRIYLLNALTNNNVQPEEQLDREIKSALSVIGRSKLMTPVYNVQHALSDNPGPISRRPNNPQYAGLPSDISKDFQPYTEITVGNGGQMLKFSTIQEFFKYLHQDLPQVTTTDLKAGRLESALIGAEKEDKYYFGVEFSVNIALDGKPPMQLKKREVIGYFKIQEPYDARLSDTVLIARFEELAHQYAKLMVYDFSIQVGNMLQINPNIRTDFMILNSPPLNDRRNPILQSLQRNSGLYTPVIGFSNLSIPGHAKVQPNRN